MIVRAARPDDVGAVTRVLAAAFEQYRPVATDSAETRATFARYLVDLTDPRVVAGEHEVFVAEAAGAIVGTASLVPPGAAATPAGAPPWPAAWASLRRLAVEPGQRGRGVGRALTDARVARARQLGAPVVALHTSPRFDAAYAMYRAAGWCRAPEYDWHPTPQHAAEAFTLALA